MYPNVSIIILNWNGWKDTLECLESLYQINYPNYDIILIDNDSKDNSVEKIKEYCEGKIEPKSKYLHYDIIKPIKVSEYTNKELEFFKNNTKKFNAEDSRLILIKNDKNYGFAGGNNIGICFSLKNLQPDYILLLNNDTVVEKNFLKELVKTAESQTDIGFIGAKTFFYDKENIIQVAGGSYISSRFLTLELGLNHIDDGSYDIETDLDYISGSCVLCKAEMLKKIGLMDTNYFMYWEDADWGIRGKKYGYKSAYSYKSKIWHKVGSSSQSYFQEYYFYRNRIYFMRKNKNKKDYFKFIVKFFAFIFLLESKYFLINKKDIKGYKNYLSAILDGFKV
ncbi:glycosyltransferase family 2 protein [Methanobacterium sp. ACI-7]|uniref:glycosyltransferase family 2 protein n=1 Tax=unclassified Methanobacterium TaxID=2627676 RepID=UPI0039C3407F